MICMRIIWCTMWPLLVSLCDLYDSILYHPLYNETCNIYLHFYLKLPSHYLQVFTWAKLDCTGDTWLRWGWQCFHFCTYFRILIKNGMKYHTQEIDYKTYNTLYFKPSFANTLWIGEVFVYLFIHFIYIHWKTYFAKNW